jgi:hypothetical protein
MIKKKNKAAAKSAEPKKEKSTNTGWMKKGKAAAESMEQEEQKAQAAKEAAGKPRRYWMPPNKDNMITFMDGALDDDGVLDMLMYYEHSMFLNGSYQNYFICTQDSEPCPLCQGGDKPYLAGALTIIDHDKYTAKDGTVYEDQIKLFIAKRGTVKQLQKIAAKRGGLTGATFDVSRTGDKEAGVGNVFDYDETNTLKEIQKELPDTVCEPLDYGEFLEYRTADELRKLGFGTKAMGSADQSGSDAGQSYKNEL